MLTAKHSTDSDVVYGEEDGYVPLDEEDNMASETGDFCSSFFFINMSDVLTCTQRSNTGGKRG